MENNKDYIFILEKTIDKMDTMLINLLMKQSINGVEVKDIKALIDEVLKLKTTVSLIKELEVLYEFR